MVARTIDTGTPAFTLVVLLGRESSVSAGVALVRAFLLGLGAAVIVVAALAGLLARRLGDRLARVDAAAGRVAAGDLTARVEDDGDDEVVHLADSFNDMAERLGGGASGSETSCSMWDTICGRRSRAFRATPRRWPMGTIGADRPPQGGARSCNVRAGASPDWSRT